MRLWSLTFLGWLSLSFIPLGWAQEAKKEEKANLAFGKTTELEMEMTRVPDSVAGSGGKPAPVGIEVKEASQDARWLRIDVPFSTTNRFTPEVKFRFSLEGYEGVPAAEAGKMTVKFVVLTGEATYRDVPAGKKHFAAVFLPPASVLRFAVHKLGGEMDWAKGLMNLRVEATEGGAPVEKVFDLQSEKDKGPSGRGGKKDPDWNKSSDATEVSGVLLPIYETPFWPTDYKRYSQPKKP